MFNIDPIWGRENITWVKCFPNPLGCMSEIDREEFIGSVHNHLNEYIRFGDRKASLILYANLTFLVIIGSLLNTVWADIVIPFKIFAILTILAALSGAAFAGLAIYPRTTDSPATYFLWTNIIANEPEEFKESIRLLTEEECFETIVEDVHILASIANRKYRYLRLAMISMAAMVSFAVLGGAVLLIGK